MASTDLVLLSDDPGAVLDVADDPARSVELMLQRSKTWLAQAAEIDDVREFRDRAAAMRVYIIKRELGTDVVLDGTEMVRRAERRLAQIYRQGVADGEFKAEREGRNTTTDANGQFAPLDSNEYSTVDKPRALDYFGHPNERAACFRLADLTDDEFDDIVDKAHDAGKGLSLSYLATEAKALRRAKAAESVPEPTPSAPQPKPERDPYHYRTRRIDAHRIVEQTYYAIDGLTMGLKQLDYSELTPVYAAEWADHLRGPMRSLRQLVNRLERVAQGEQP